VSGICGIIRFDGAVEPTAASAMSAAIAHRGGDAAGVHADGPAALAATLRHDTPESLREKQPLVGEGGLVVVADARLDNRDELIAALGRTGAPAPTDADIILAAIEAWGDDAPARLVGDFAFAAWDPAGRRLLCARDHLGVRPFAYIHRPGHLFAFASEIKALFAAPGVPREVSDTAVIAYLDGRDIAQDETFFRWVGRLPPAHRLILEDGRMRVERYWSLDPERENFLPGSDDYVDGFREQFDRAVAARLRSVRPVGVMLSGGLDSSSIAVTARGLAGGPALPTFSYRFDDVAASDERRFQDLVLAGGGYDSHVVRGDALDPFLDFDRIVHHADEPTGAGNLFLHWAAWGQARDAGVRVMLDGFFGDSTVSYGDDRLSELVRSGRLLTWAHEMRARRRVDGGGRRMLLGLVTSSVRAALPHIGGAGTRGPLSRQQSPVFVPLDASAAGRLPARVPDFGHGFYGVRRRQLEDITHEAYTPVFEVMDKASAGQGVDVRFPFADRRLVEYCLALPSAMKQRDGRDRWVLRAAMEGRLPEAVRLRADKADLLPNLGHTLRTTGRERLAAELEDRNGPLARFVDWAGIEQLLQRLDAGDHAAIAPLWTAACASTWLRAEAGAIRPAEYRPLPEA